MMTYSEWHNRSVAAASSGQSQQYYYGWASISNNFRHAAAAAVTTKKHGGGRFDFIGQDLASLTRERAPALLAPWPEPMQASSWVAARSYSCCIYPLPK